MDLEEWSKTNEHGTPGGSLDKISAAARYGKGPAWRGAVIERATARALRTWLAGRPDAEKFHLFHDLGDFINVPGRVHEPTGKIFPPMNIGGRNIDHLILSGTQWVMIDSKGVGRGIIGTENGKGYLFKPDGTKQSLPWMNKMSHWGMVGCLWRLTGLDGYPAWVYPSATDSRPDCLEAKCMSRGSGGMCSISEVYEGWLDNLFGGNFEGLPILPADPAHVQALMPYVR